MICAGFLRGKLDACEVRRDSDLQNASVSRDALTEHRSVSLPVTTMTSAASSEEEEESQDESEILEE